MPVEPYLGEICLFAIGYAPRGWANCEGQLLPINQNQALFALLGTQYGGNGQTTFALPDLRGRVAIGQGQGIGLTQRIIGQRDGAEVHTLTIPQMPAHRHSFRGTSADATTNDPRKAVFARPRVNGATQKLYSGGPSNALARVPAITSVGADQPHNNVQPVLGMRYCIALVGIFPPMD